MIPKRGLRQPKPLLTHSLPKEKKKWRENVAGKTVYVTQTMQSEEALQQAANNLKLKLQQWETKFVAKEGRKPTKQDVLQLPKIAKKFKTYSTLKRKLGISAPSDTTQKESEPTSLKKDVMSIDKASCDKKPAPVDVSIKENSPTDSQRNQMPSTPTRNTEPSFDHGPIPNLMSPNFFLKTRMKRNNSLLNFSVKAIPPSLPDPAPMRMDFDQIQVKEKEVEKQDNNKQAAEATTAPKRRIAKRAKFQKEKKEEEKESVPAEKDSRSKRKRKDNKDSESDYEEEKEKAKPVSVKKRRVGPSKDSPVKPEVSAKGKRRRIERGEDYTPSYDTTATINTNTNSNSISNKKEDSNNDKQQGNRDYMANGNFVRMRLKSRRGGRGKRGGFGGRHKFLGGRTNKRTWNKGKEGYNSRNNNGSSSRMGDDTPFAETSAASREVKSFPLLDIDFAMIDAMETMATSTPQPIEPKLYSSEELHAILEDNFGFTSFRDGQEEAITRVLQGLSTLLIIPTGAGKSLCYQMAALLQPNSLVLVVCPLVALMRDQLDNLPSCVKGAAINSQMSSTEQDQVVESVRAGKIRILFVSPEKIATSQFARLCSSFPPISLACIDEAHCVSEWSHNFRTSYLRLNHLLKAKLGAKCILGLTATVTKRAQAAVMEILEIPPEGVIRSSSVIRPNICCTVSTDSDRHRALIELLKSERFAGCLPVIIYCMFQREADELAAFLQERLYNAASYHAGKPSQERTRLQNKFFENKLDIIVATVAFGMGINKKDIKGIIHYNLPKSLENYVQEVGRCGRDGQHSQCHLFLSEEDHSKLRSYAYSDSIDEAPVFAFCKKIFNRKLHTGEDWQELEEEKESEEEEEEEEEYEKEKKKEVSKDQSYLVSVSTSGIELELDIRREVIETIMSYLEMDGYIQVLPTCNVIARVYFYKTDPQELKSKSLLVDAILKRAKHDKHNGYYDVDCIALLNNEFKGSALFELQREFDQLKYLGEITLETLNEAFVMRVLRKPEKMLDVASRCFRKTRFLELSKVSKIRSIFRVMKSVAFPSYAEAAKITSQENDNGLCRLVAEYFNEDEDDVLQEEKVMPLPKPVDKPDVIRNDIRVFLSRFAGNLTGRQVAKILHGMTSPQLGRDEWQTNPFWKRYQDVDFNKLKELATEEIIAYKARKGAVAENKED